MLQSKEKKELDQLERELKEYLRSGVEVSLEGHRYDCREIVQMVAENDNYMRDYEFNNGGKLKKVDFVLLDLND